jgi:hypothetical protein
LEGVDAELEAKLHYEKWVFSGENNLANCLRRGVGPVSLYSHLESKSFFIFAPSSFIPIDS